MCKEKRYQKYQIEVVYTNGDKEVLKLAGINTESYSKMLDVYKSVKDKYKNEAIAIKFLGITKNNGLEVLFTKEFKENINNDLERDFVEIAKEISDKLLLISKKIKHDDTMARMMDKKRDVMLHRLRNFTGDETDKINFFNELQDIELKRDWYKNQHVLEQEFINNHDNYNFKYKVGNFSELTFDEAKRLKIYEEKIVNNLHKDTKCMENKYNNVFYNESNNTIYGYNNSIRKAI